MRRWKKRGTISDQEFTNRKQSARQELSVALSEDYYHFIINDDLEEVVKGVCQIAKGIVSKQHDQEGRAVAENILQRLS